MFAENKVRQKSLTDAKSSEWLQEIEDRFSVVSSVNRTFEWGTEL